MNTFKAITKESTISVEGTVRERDSMEQVRVPISQLKTYLTEKLAY